MAPLTQRLLVALVVVLMSVPSAPVAAQDGDTDASGFVFVQVDGLSEPVLRQALASGAMPFLSGLIDEGSYLLGSWHTTAASTTTVAQAAVLHGRWHDIPGFRWWDRETGQLIDFLDREQARLFEEGIDGPGDLLADGGASITNLFSGGAPRVVFTATHLDGLVLPWEVVRYFVDVPKTRHVVAGFVDGVVSGLRRVVRGDAAPFAPGIKRKAPVPILGPALEWALVDVTAAAVVRELQRGTPRVFATFTTYDEVGHYAGPDHPAAIDALRHIDEALGAIAVAAGAAPRAYHLVVLSDHGQSDGESFELRYGETLTDVVRGLWSGPPGGDRADETPGLVVAASGNLAHIYLAAQGRRLDAAEIEAAHPGLVTGLVAHPGVGVVVIQAHDGGLLAIGPDGSHDLMSGAVERADPVERYGTFAAESLANIAASPNAGDLVVVSMYDPATDEVASFEPQIGSHGGIGGPQTRPFLLYPSELEPTTEPLALEGVDALRARIVEWLATSEAGPPPHVGEQVCVTAEVSGGSAEVCAHRERFGASWTLEVRDTADDGRPVRATVGLVVEEGLDQSAALQNDLGLGRAAVSSGTFSPRVGSAIGDVSVETCVIVRFGRDRCQTRSVALPQLASRASPAQLTRLEKLLFELPIDRFMAVWQQEHRSGVDADFDWSADGCSAGPFADLVDDRLEAACIRHDFAYRNLGRRFFDPTDEARRRVDEQLGTDATVLGQARVAAGLTETLQRFGAPGFYGTDLATAWNARACGASPQACDAATGC